LWRPPRRPASEKRLPAEINADHQTASDAEKPARAWATKLLKGKHEDRTKARRRVVPLPTAGTTPMPQSTYGSGSERFGDAAKEQMKRVGDQPMATLAVAAIVGFVLGAIWKA
jgi:ElaB/YqjD/DUF883 family membrane-anchored ribosome-binding protein